MSSSFGLSLLDDPQEILDLGDPERKRGPRHEVAVLGNEILGARPLGERRDERVAGLEAPFLVSGARLERNLPAFDRLDIHGCQEAPEHAVRPWREVLLDLLKDGPADDQLETVGRVDEKAEQLGGNGRAGL